MESKVVKNLTVDAKLVVHLVLPRAGTFRQRNFFIARKATNRLWVTLRSQEGSHEKSFSYPENCAFSKPNRTFHRRSGQLSTRRKERMAKYRRCGRRAHASSNNSPAKVNKRVVALDMLLPPRTTKFFCPISHGIKRHGF